MSTSTVSERNLLEISPQHNSLDLQAPRRQLSDKGVAHRSNTQLVEQRPHNHDATSCHGCLLLLTVRCQAQKAQDE